jgi:hypothetical protein
VADPLADLTDEQWSADLFFGEEPQSGVTLGTAARSDDACSADEEPTESSASSATEPPAPTDDLAPDDPNRGAKRAAVGLGAGLVAAAAAIVAALGSSGAPSAPTDHPPTTTHRVPTPAPAPTSAVAEAPEQDQAIAFTASADCPAGSTSAQSLTDAVHDSAWVCVRGTADTAVDGQVLAVDFGTSHVLTAVAVTPGWVAKTTGGRDEWLQHRVVSRLQYDFNDDGRTIVTQDTGAAHGPVTLPLPHPVLASRVTVIVLRTARPPATPPTSADHSTTDASDLLGSVLHDGDAPVTPDIDPTGSSTPDGDPVDATFAISSMQFFGHGPR